MEGDRHGRGARIDQKANGRQAKALVSEARDAGMDDESIIVVLEEAIGALLEGLS